MTITSTAFQADEHIPEEYGYSGKNVSPPLTLSEVPKEAKSLVLILEDPDAPGGLFTHWILYNISPATLQITEGRLPIGAVPATNDFGQTAYGGPQPPSDTHRYIFRLFALGKTLDVPPSSKRTDIDAGMKGHVIDQAELIGLFSA